jgi:Ca2+-binding RTX toxin-like protein
MSSPDSVQTRVLRSASGPQIKDGDRVWVWYAGELMDGTPFDANFNFTSFSPEPARTPFPFILGSGQVIRGWDLALSERRLGEVLELTIPSNLAYGSIGAPPQIPADADLRFTIELLAIGNPGQFTFATFGDIGVDLRAAAALGVNLDSYTFRIGLDRADGLIGSSISDGLAGLGEDDILSGLDGEDLLLGGSGDDQLAGGLGNDLLDGGDGTDTARFGSMANILNLSITGPQQTGEGRERLVSIENITGGGGNDQITGNNLINSLDGGVGRDRLIGGGGADELSGGLGADQFLYSLPTDSSRGSSRRDTISDFKGRDGDRINLATIDANSLQAGDQAFRFIGSQAFSGRPGEARFISGLLALNSNASNEAEMEIVLSGVRNLQVGFLIL